MPGSNHSDRLCFGPTASGSMFNLTRQEGSTAEGGAVPAGVARRCDPGAGDSRRNIRSRYARLRCRIPRTGAPAPGSDARATPTHI